MEDIKFTIPLPPVSKKNSPRIITVRPKGKKEYQRLLPSEAYERYEQDAGWFIPHRGARLSRPCEVVELFYMPDHRIVDLTNLEESIDDIMVKYKLLQDDNSRIIVSHDGSRVLYDKEHPRTEVAIRFL